MRIISGKYRSKRITAPAKLPVRPTTDLAKESLFNILLNHFDLEDVKVLDLFAGTGNISYEFASRDVPSITAVDNNSYCTDFIRKQAAELKIEGLHVIRMDVFAFLKRAGSQYDIIFADPPYGLENITEIPDLVLTNSFLKDDGMLIVEHSHYTSFENHPFLFQHRKYGNTHFSIFKKLP